MTTPDPRTAVSSLMAALDRAGIRGAWSFQGKTDSRTTVVVRCWDAAAVGRAARALDAAGYDVHTPVSRPAELEAQHYGHAAAELEAEAAAAELAGDTQRAEEKRAQVALCWQLLAYAEQNPPRRAA